MVAGVYTGGALIAEVEDLALSKRPKQCAHLVTSVWSAEPFVRQGSSWNASGVAGVYIGMGSHSGSSLA